MVLPLSLKIYKTMKTPLTPRTLDLFKQKGNGTLDLIAPEVFYKIMVFLQPKDIQTCMCVSKKWKVSEFSVNL